MKANNNKAMREALAKMTDWMEKHTAIFSVQVSPREEDPDEVEREKDEAISLARAALAAPPRNCDLFDTKDKSREAFQKLRGHCVWADVSLWDNREEIEAFLDWLFATKKGENYGGE